MIYHWCQYRPEMTKLNENINPKLSSTVIQQLKRRNITNVVEFVGEDAEKLARISGLSYKDILEIKESILTICGPKIRTGLDKLIAEEKNIVSSGIESLDTLLNGGFYPGQIYELCGVSSSGKTQLCLTLVANISSRPNSITRYIDTKSDFCGSRVTEILLAQKYSNQAVDEILDRIKVCSIENTSELLKVLRWLPINLALEEEDLRTRVLIIDSLPALIFKYSKDHETTYLLNHVASICHFIANEFNITVITVNIIIKWSQSNSENDVPEKKAALGKYWAHVPNTRIMIEKLNSKIRKFTVWKSSQLEENTSCTMNLNTSGIN